MEKSAIRYIFERSVRIKDTNKIPVKSLLAAFKKDDKSRIRRKGDRPMEFIGKSDGSGQREFNCQC